MPPKQAGAKLSTVIPTQQELDAARKILAGTDKKALKSKFASMAHWLKDNPDHAVASSRGEDRRAYLEQFMVFQMRQKGTSTTQVSSSVVESGKQKHQDLRWWSREKMNMELGEKKAESWRNSGKLATRPDPVTGSTDENFIEYGCPDDWDSFVQNDMDRYEVNAAGEADDGDLELLRSVASGGKTAKVAVKVEPKTAEEIANQKAIDLKENPRPMLRRFQDYELECKLLATKAEDTRYTSELATDVKKYLVKVAKVIKLLNNMCTTVMQSSEVGKVVDMTEKLIQEHDTLLEWAQQFGLAEKAKKRSRKA